MAKAVRAWQQLATNEKDEQNGEEGRGERERPESESLLEELLEVGLEVDGMFGGHGRGFLRWLGEGSTGRRLAGGGGGRGGAMEGLALVRVDRLAFEGGILLDRLDGNVRILLHEGILCRRRRLRLRLRVRVRVRVRGRLDDVEEPSLVDLVPLQGRLEIGSVGLVEILLLVGGVEGVGEMFAARQRGLADGGGRVELRLEERVLRPSVRVETLVDHLVERRRALFEEVREELEGVRGGEDPHESAALSVFLFDRAQNLRLFRRQAEVVVAFGLVVRLFLPVRRVRVGVVVGRRDVRSVGRRRPGITDRRVRIGRVLGRTRTQRVTSGDRTTLNTNIDI